MRALEDHPRVCGENPSREKYLPAAVGSPPRVRGKRAARERMLGIQRITPACAGKTSSSTAPSLSQQDHPRVCGENMIKSEVVRVTWGSPPRVRGKRTGWRPSEVEDRITPACAGKTPAPLWQKRHGWDHPRVCGENLHRRAYDSHPRGSPPRVRGKPQVQRLP